MITLAVPIHNMELFLNRFMKTVLSQTHNDFEVILVDDGSTDSSGKMCDDYARQYPDFIRVIHKINGGLSSARNIGIDSAKGEYIVFPDPDDWLEPDYVETFIELLNRGSVDMACIGHYIEFDEYTLVANKDCHFIRMNQQEAKRSLLLNPRINGFAWNKLFRLDVIKCNGLHFLDDVGTIEDLDFAYRYLKYCNMICFAPEKRVYHYYQRTGAATHSGFSKHKIDSIHAYEKIIDDTNDTVLCQAARISICDAAINLLWSYRNSNTKDKGSYKKLKRTLNENISHYLKSPYISKGRKLQAVLAMVSPGIYCCIKNKVNKA